MEKVVVEVIVMIFSLLVAVLGFFLKRAFSQIDTNEKNIEEIREQIATIREQCATCRTEAATSVLEKFMQLLDEKLEAWGTKFELMLMNEGRIPPRKKKE